MIEDRSNSRQDPKHVYCNLPQNLERLLPGHRIGKGYGLRAFGQSCQIRPDGVDVGTGKETGVMGRLVLTYALNASVEPCRPTPFKAYRELPESLLYVDHFTANAEQILNPYISRIEHNLERLFKAFNGELCQDIEGGDLSIILRPLPKIQLCYNFYETENELPASVTCLFSNNALSFLPIDALAELAGCTSKKIIELRPGRTCWVHLEKNHRADRPVARIRL